MGELDRRGDDTLTRGDSVGRPTVGDDETRIVGEGSTSTEDFFCGGGTDGGMLTEIFGVAVCLMDDVDGVDRRGGTAADGLGEGVGFSGDGCTGARSPVDDALLLAACELALDSLL